MAQYETINLTPGEKQTGLTTEESNANLDTSSPYYQGGDQKKPSILGKLKDKTKKAGSKIKSKVGKNKGGDGTAGATPTGAGAVDDEDDDEDDEDDDDVPSPSPAGGAASGVQTTPYTGPASVPREFGSYPGESKGTDSTTPDIGGLSLGDSSAPGGGSAPSATDKASGVSQGAKDVAYGGAAATAGALGYDELSKGDGKSVTDKASDTAGQAGDQANQATGAIADTGNAAADQTKGAAYGTRDAVQAKAGDVNNATGDSQTYTEKAGNAATAAKDTVAGQLGIDQSSQAPPVVDQAKGYFGSTVDTAKAKTGLDQPSQGPSVVDQAKGYFGSAAGTTKDAQGTAQDKANSAADTTKDTAQSATDTTKGAAQSATDTTKDYATSAKDSAADAATPKDDDKALSDKITETLGGLTSPANTSTGAAGDQANPGILGKLGGVFGYPQKAPGDTTTPTQ